MSVTDLQEQILQHPYSVLRRLRLCDSYSELRYPDLAAGEAYVALLLCDEIRDESGEFHEQAFAAAEEDIKESLLDIASPVEWLESGLDLRVYTTLVASLNACGCLRNALLFCIRGLEKFKEDADLLELKGRIEQKILNTSALQDISGIVIDEICDDTKVRREIYPWNNHEPDRCSDESITFLNHQLSVVAPKLEVQAVELPDLSSTSSTQTYRQLGLYAKTDIAPGEEILNEKSLLTGTNRLLSEVCDACSLTRGLDSSRLAYCEDCTDTTVFCSAECHDLAVQSYHPAICDTDALAIGKDPQPKDAADAMYAQLLLRTFAMAITQDVHPLDLPEIKYLCGTFASPPTPSSSHTSSTTATGTDTNITNHAPPTLPFSFHHNIHLPLHFLELMDLDIFTATADRFSTSVVNTLYAKLRGVASAKQNIQSGLPDVAAVHPLWCLANHSCAPNVRWEWDGAMRFWAREERVAWGGGNDDHGGDGRDEASRVDGAAATTAAAMNVGIKAGEEILSHYCDITLPVKERREWAAGALGGECRCARCIWESQVTLNSR